MRVSNSNDSKVKLADSGHLTELDALAEVTDTGRP